MYSMKVIEFSQLHILLRKIDLWHRSTGSTKSSRIALCLYFCTWHSTHRPAYITIILTNMCIKDTWDFSSQLGSQGRQKAHWTWWMLSPDWVMMVFQGSQWMEQLMSIQFINVLCINASIYSHEQMLMTFHNPWIPRKDKLAWKWSISQKSQ